MTVVHVDAASQWFGKRYPTTPVVPCRKWLVHMTETPGLGKDLKPRWPGYDGGAKAPNETIVLDLPNRVMLVREHFAAGAPSRALRNEDGGVQTNHVPGGVHQTEIAGTCDPETSRKWQALGYRPGVHYLESWDLPAWVVSALAEHWLTLRTRIGVPLVLGSRQWVPYPASAGARASQRLHGAAWVNAKGLVGHEHADENVHGDPGALPAEAILAEALRLDAGTPAPEEDDVKLDDLIPLGRDGKNEVGNGDSMIGVGEALALAARGGKAALGLRPAVAQLAADVAVLRTAIASGGGATESQLIAAGKAGADAALAALGDKLRD